MKPEPTPLPTPHWARDCHGETEVYTAAEMSAHAAARDAAWLAVQKPAPTMGAVMALTAHKNRLEAALTLACSYLTDAQVAEIAAAMPPEGSEPRTCTQAKLDAAVAQAHSGALLLVIQALNQNPYSLTKSECIDVVHGLVARTQGGGNHG